MHSALVECDFEALKDNHHASHEPLVSDSLWMEMLHFPFKLDWPQKPQG